MANRFLNKFTDKVVAMKWMACAGDCGMPVAPALRKKFTDRLRRQYILGFLLSCLFFRAPAQQNTLDYYVSHAVTNSPLLQDFRNQATSLSLDSQLYLASLRPLVSGVSNNMYAPVIHGYGYDEAITNGAQLSAMVSVNKSFFTNSAIAAQFSGFRIQSQSILNNLRISQQDITRTITDQYITTYGDLLQVDINRQINALLQGEDTLLKRLAQNNVFRQSEYLAFTVTLQQQLLTTSQLEMQYDFDLATLNYLAGIVDSAAARLEEPQLLLTPAAEYHTSVFYRQFELDSLQLLNDRALIELSYRPKVSAFADAGYNSTLAYQAYRNFGMSAGLSVSIPIYDGRQKRLRYSKIDLQENTRIARRNFFKRQHDQQISQLSRQLQSTERLIQQVDQQIKYTETLITVNEKLLATGDIRIADFLITLGNYINTKNLVAQNHISRLRIINQLNYWSK